MSETNHNAGPSDEQLFKKRASFIQHSLPGLEAGSYEISVQQALEHTDGTSITGGDLASLTRQFGVEGPRYSLPQNVVHSVFPPKSSAGGFSNSLAHVVMERETLPWIRNPYMPGKEPAVEERHYEATYGDPAKAHPITYDDDKATWMAVLLLSPSDLGGIDPEKQVVSGKASDLVPNSLKMLNPGGTPVPGTLAADGYSIFSCYLEPGIGTSDPVDPGVGHTPDEACNYIDIPAALFDKLAPSLDDLQMMAHVRAVEMDSKPIQQGQTVQAEERYGLVMGNRIPETMPATKIPPEIQTAPAIGKNVAMLISLESMQGALRGHSASNYYAQNVANQPGGFVRLIVLYQWSFTSWQDTTFEFEHILKSLNGRDAATTSPSPKVPNPLLRLPQPDPPGYPSGADDQKVVQDMLKLGYTPMNHLTRVPYVENGETDKIQTVSWYRGPLIPFDRDATISFVSGSISAPASQESLIFSADQLLRFDPNVGMYDTSYAAAWQLGQLVSLSNKSFSVPLYRWKQSVSQQFRMLLEDEALQLNYQDLIDLYKAVLVEEGQLVTGKTMYKSVLHLLAANQQ